MVQSQIELRAIHAIPMYGDSRRLDDCQGRRAPPWKGHGLFVAPGVSMAKRSSQTTKSAEEFVHILLESGLVSSEEIEKAKRALSGAGLATDEDALARHLTESGRLT